MSFQRHSDCGNMDARIKRLYPCKNDVQRSSTEEGRQLQTQMQEKRPQIYLVVTNGTTCLERSARSCGTGVRVGYLEKDFQRLTIPDFAVLNLVDEFQTRYLEKMRGMKNKNTSKQRPPVMNWHKLLMLL